MTQMPEAQIIEQFDTKLMPDINSGDSFLNRAKKLVGYAATAAGLSLGAAVVVDEAYDPVVTFAEGIPPGSHHCAPGEVPYDLMPIADANGDVTWIDICYDTNGGGGSGGSGGSSPSMRKSSPRPSRTAPRARPRGVRSARRRRG